MAEKLDLKSMDITQDNIAKIKALFPSAVTEIMGDDGKVKLGIDFDVLRQELSDDLISERAERYQMTWPDKSKAKVLANSRINATLRPDKEKSVDFDNTENLYIEGDNLDVLKLLRETYLGKVKMIYIDPPYNTGSDFVYNDDFAMSADDYDEVSGQYDEQGNRLVKNLDSNGRFHTDWLNMIYPRLKVARDLLSDDGVIFMSIDDNEVDNLRKICDEIFGINNFVNTIALEITPSSGVKRAHKEKMYIKNTEFLLVYRKTESFKLKPLYDEWLNFDKHYSIFFDENSYGTLSEQVKKIGAQYSSIKSEYYMYFEPIKKFIISNSANIYRTHDASKWAITSVSDDKVIYDRERKIFKVYNPDDNSEYELLIEVGENKYNRLEPLSWNLIDGKIQTLRGNLWLDFDKDIGNVSKEGEIPYPCGKKPLRLLTDIIHSVTNDGDIVMDFFSGSATTGHAVMEVNALQKTKRKFILVQLPEVIDYTNKDNVKYYKKYNFKTICDLGEKRLAIAGEQLKNSAEKDIPSLFDDNSNKNYLDIGFRVLKLDSSNMQEVYYNPSAMTQDILAMTVDNVKADRTPLDLLFQVMLDLGIELSAKIDEHTVNGKTYYAVNENDIIACFDDDIDNDVITAIAKQNPLYAVFKDKSFATDSVGINNEQLFKTYSPSTVVKVI